VKPNKSRCCGQLFCFQHLSDVSLRPSFRRCRLKRDGSGCPQPVQMGAVQHAVSPYHSKEIQSHSTLRRSPSSQLSVFCRRRCLQDGVPLLASGLVDLFLVHAAPHRARVQAQVKNTTRTWDRLPRHQRARMVPCQSAAVHHPSNRNTSLCPT
jgi:hypothetical protein